MRFPIKTLVLALVLAGCGSSDSKSNDAAKAEALAKASASEAYFRSSTLINVEVWYQANAEPYVQSLAEQDFWDITRQNLTAIFQYRTAPPTITVPSKLNEMGTLSVPAQDNWTADQVLALAAANKKPVASGSSTFYVYFLDGYFNDGDGKGSNKGILGVSFGGTNVIAMFKPVIRSTSSGVAEVVPKFVEQSTLVHEMGHALGFVNNGVPMVTAHQDTEHGAHSTNQDCVMYWLNEGSENLKKFVLKYISTKNLVMWGPEVLADAKAISR